MDISLDKLQSKSRMVHVLNGLFIVDGNILGNSGVFKSWGLAVRESMSL